MYVMQVVTMCPTYKYVIFIPVKPVQVAKKLEKMCLVCEKSMECAASFKDTGF